MWGAVVWGWGSVGCSVVCSLVQSVVWGVV